MAIVVILFAELAARSIPIERMAEAAILAGQ